MISDNTDEVAIRSVVELWHSATASGDVNTVLGLMAEDVIFLVAGQPPMRGRSSFESGLRGLLASHRLESTAEIREIQLSGDLAYCWTALKVQITPLAGGAPVTRAGSALSIFRKMRDGRWLVVRDVNLLAVTS